jgi:hypothetical protein
MAPHHADLRANATVSVWLGDFRSEAALDDYMRGRFSDDFGFEYEPRASPEACAQPEPVSIAELLNGFSQWRHFVDHAVERAALAGLSEASAAVVFYGTRYDPNLATAHSAPLRFLAAIELLPRAEKPNAPTSDDQARRRHHRVRRPTSR